MAGSQPLVNLTTPQNSQNDAAVGEDRRREIIKQYTRIREAQTALGTTVTEPHNRYGAAYPHNKVHSTQSGHVREMDDTPGFERISEMHRTGTYYEINSRGDKVEKVFGDDWHVTIKDNVLVVGGARHVIVEGDATFMVKGSMTGRVAGNYKLEVDGNYTLRVKGEMNEFCEKNINRQALLNMVYKCDNLFSEIASAERRSVGSDQDIVVGGSQKENVSGTKSSTVGGEYSASSGGSGTFSWSGGLGIPKGVIEGALKANQAGSAPPGAGSGPGPMPSGGIQSATVESIESNDPGEGNPIINYRVKRLGEFRYGGETVSDRRNYSATVPGLEVVSEFPLINLRRISYE